jgi:hypothetical protein
LRIEAGVKYVLEIDDESGVVKMEQDMAVDNPATMGAMITKRPNPKETTRRQLSAFVATTFCFILLMSLNNSQWISN